MKFKIRKDDKALIATLEDYTHKIIDAEEDEWSITVDMVCIDIFIKQECHSGRYMCIIKKIEPCTTETEELYCVTDKNIYDLSFEQLESLRIYNAGEE